MSHSLAPADAIAVQNPTGEMGERTYRGLTLDHWLSTVPAPADPLRYSTEEASARVNSLVASLELFAPFSERAVLELARLASDLDWGTRERAVEALAEVAFTQVATSPVARTELMLLLRNPDLEVSQEVLGQLLDGFVDESTDWMNLGAALPLAEATRDACLRALDEAPEWQFLEDILSFSLAFEPTAPGGIAKVIAIVEQMPRDIDHEVDGGDLRSFAWELIAVDDKAPKRGLDLALVAARAGTRFTPEDPYAWNTLALTLWRLGQRDASLEAMQMCLEVGAELSRDNLHGFERNESMLRDEANWTEEARATARNRPE